ncbi:hypothetical protein TVAG_067420 [Trichomonas vaginalis G3]|uniref:Uncharacterized protein n=1 Tax=Trichomonas vaginalis (strain ATCC PRA-98 / G3) TaxID=412133 RepID=A2DSF8_TRIV3|nr:hypothetical protein TVAGG3_0079980 [Trichomonas vaginalis G3]EAY16737.1 hypothetical protein TVAG_067420 [Trichomonas vaginalis G3]KAI5543178.1 hypothetical protein TVAGG3_0079980 [Trichomonas vaginalis G3]|eukprot:XP_001328960.1 hypothetical protein [Trichomonas vaginalis G3]
MAKQIVERNQAFVEKVIKENETLLLAYDQLKQELAETKFELNNCKKNTLKEIEPRIQKLLDDHKAELAKQKETISAKYEADIAQLNSDFEKKRLILVQQNADTEERCHQKLIKLKERALGREKEIKDVMSKRVEEVYAKIEEAKQQAKREEEIARTAWQKLITDKIRAEFQEKAEQDANRIKSRQEKMLMDVVGKLEADAHDEANQLKAQLEKEKQEHKIVETRLRSRIENLEQTINTMKESDKSEKHSLEEKILDLNSQISKCRCNEYRDEIKTLNNQINDYKNQIQQLILKQNSSKNAENQQMQQIKQENSNLNKKIQDLQEQINQINDQHKNELSLIAERVKKTVELKDARIQQLIGQIEKLTGHPI